MIAIKINGTLTITFTDPADTFDIKDGAGRGMARVDNSGNVQLASYYTTQMEIGTIGPNISA